MKTNRRNVLSYFGAGSMVGLGGCLSFNNKDTKNYNYCTSSDSSSNTPDELGGWWPMTRFDANNSAVNTEAEGLTTTEEAWILDSGGTPVFAHGGLFVLERQLSVRNPLDGTTCAEVEATENSAGMPPTVAEGAVYTSTYAGLTAVTLDELRTEWQTESFSTVRSPPIVSDGFALVTALTDSDETVGLRAYDTETGTLRWQYVTNRPFWSIPSVGSSAVYATTERGLHAVNLDDGSERFVLEESGFDTTIPVVSDGRVYCRRHLGENTFELVCLDAGAGDIHWRRDLGADVSSPPVAHPDFLLVESERGLLRIDTQSDGDGEAIYWGGSPLAVVGDVVYVQAGSAGEELHALLVDEEPLWTYTTGQKKRGDEVDVGIRGIAPVSGGVFVSAADGIHSLLST